jgi:hypothetical protein
MNAEPRRIGAIEIDLKYKELMIKNKTILESSATLF